MLERFRQFIAKENLFQRNQKILLAISGGMDSICMLHLMHLSGYEFGIAHCNFGLRGAESDADEALVKRLATQYNVPFFLRKFDTTAYALERHISIQMAARDLRYAFFDEISMLEGYDYIAIAHHKNDSVETIFLNWIKGTGSKGLSGIEIKRGNVVRPLLRFDKREIERYVLQQNLEYREDSSNEKTEYQRNKVRHTIIPLVREINPSFEETCLNNARIQQELEAIKNEYLDQFVQAHVTYYSKGFSVDLKALMQSSAPITLLYGLLAPLGFEEGMVRDFLQSSNMQTGKFIENHVYKVMVERGLIQVHQQMEDQDKFQTNIPLSALPIQVLLQGKDWNISMLKAWDLNKIKQSNANEELFLDTQVFKSNVLSIRAWKEGDSMQVLGMKGQKNISDILTDMKCPTYERKAQLVVCAEEQIVALLGYKIAEMAKVIPNTKEVVHIKRNTFFQQ
jgi:tRNA(Ile)-lysidine synthase